MKKCNGCQKSKPLDRFRMRSPAQAAVRRTETSKRHSLCRECEGKRRQSYDYYVWEKLARNLNRNGAVHVFIDQLKALGKPEETACYLCGDPIRGQPFELDHTKPRSKGGDNHPKNLAWTHKRCNRIKHDLSLAELKAILKKILRHLP